MKYKKRYVLKVRKHWIRGVYWALDLMPTIFIQHDSKDFDPRFAEFVGYGYTVQVSWLFWSVSYTYKLERIDKQAKGRRTKK